MNQSGDSVSLEEHMRRLTVEVDGVFIAKHFLPNQSVEEHLHRLRSLDLREDDVILCTFPRSGTHWLWEVGSMLLAHHSQYGSRTKEHSMLEATPIDDLQALPSPRLLNTHLPVTFLSRQVKDKRIKVVHVYRNAKDVFVSVYHFLTQRKGIAYKGTKEEVLDWFFSEPACQQKYFGYLKAMDAFTKDNPEVPVCNLSYEDMTENPEQTVKSLGDFLGVNPDPALCSSIAEACSLEKLKTVDNSRDRPEHLNTHCLYRKGLVGEWKNFLTVAMSERFDHAMKELEGCDFRFRFEL